jgi:hypothetical protein
MKIILAFTLVLITCSGFAQNNFYTKGLANGYAWTAPASVSKLSYAKGESLTEILLRKKFQTDVQRKVSFPLDCTDDVDKLLESKSSATIELETIEKMIDEFYESKENLVIPVIGVYCYSIKKISGYSSDELKLYKEKLLDFCNNKSEE